MRAGYLRFELQTIDVHLPLARGEKRPVVKLCSPYLGYMLGWIPAFFYGSPPALLLARLRLQK